MNYGLRKPNAGRVFNSRRMNKIRSESGAVSLNELLVAAPIMLMVLMALFVLYNEGVKGQARTAGRTRGLAQQQLGVEKISKELRQATTISPVSSQIVDMDTYVAPGTGAASTLRRVRYDCSTGSCKRYEGPAGGTVFTVGPVPTITDVRNPNVFGMEPDFINPVFVNFTVQVDVSGQSNPIELSGGVQLRNLAREN